MGFRSQRYLLGAFGLVVCFSACDRASKAKLPNVMSPKAQPVSAKAANLQRSVIDVHTHLSPMSYPIVSMVLEEVGIQRVVNLSGGGESEYRRQHLAVLGDLSERVALFYNIDWSRVLDDGFGDAVAGELRHAVDEGFAGLKISKALGLRVLASDGELLAVDDRRLDPVWKMAGQLGVPVAIHIGDPKAFFERPDETNERIRELRAAPSWSFFGDEFPSRASLLEARNRVLSRHPNTVFILVHFGNNPEDIDAVAEVLRAFPNARLDVSARLAEIGRHDPAKVRRFFGEFQDRILFGTDLMIQARPRGQDLAYNVTLGSISEVPPTLAEVKPFYDVHWRYFETSGREIDHPVPIQGDWKIKPVGLPPEVLQKLYFRNAEALIFAPWLARSRARHVAQRAGSAIRLKGAGGQVADELR
jgi:hypothetical protein